MKNLITILSLFIFQFGMSQIEMNNVIKPTPNDTLHIKNIGIPADSTNLISVHDARINKLVFFEVNLQNDTFSIIMDTNTVKIRKGITVYIKSNIANSGNVTLKLNSDIYPILKSSGYEIGSGEILANKVCVLIFDGTSFIFINPELTACPTTFAQPNNSYCIEKTERSGNFWTAVNTCNNLGYRLCMWSEWYYACQNTNLGMTGRTNNWEWINNGQNEHYHGKVVGNGACTNNTFSTFTNSNFYRCCLSR
jgi:hypothetical protein